MASKAKASGKAKFEVQLANGKTAEEVADSMEDAMAQAQEHNASKALKAKKLADVED